MSYDVTRPHIKNYETTAIDSGTIWTTKVYRERASGHHDIDTTYTPTRPTKLNRNYDVDMIRNESRQRDQHQQPQQYNKDSYNTFNKNDISDRISNEFRFLEDSPITRPRSNILYPSKYWFSYYSRPVLISIAILQMFIAVSLILFACIRYFRVFSDSQTDSLLDFVKPEDFASSNVEGTSIIAMKVGSSLFAPCIMLLINGLIGLYPLYKRQPKALIILNLFFSFLVLKLLFDPIISISFELNLRNVQILNNYDNPNYRLLITAISIITIMLILINMISIVYSSSQLIKEDEISTSPLNLCVNIIVVVFSITCICFSVYSTVNSMTKVTEWPEFGIRNFAALYGLGLREVLISSFVFLSSLLCGLCVITKSRNLIFGTWTLEILSVFLIFQYILNGDRILAVSQNIDKLYKSQVISPFTPEIPLLLYIFITLMTISLLIHIALTTLYLFKKQSYQYYESSYPVSRSY